MLDCDAGHGEVVGVARRQARVDARGGGGDQTVGLLKGDTASGELLTPLSGAAFLRTGPVVHTATRA